MVMIKVQLSWFNHQHAGPFSWPVDSQSVLTKKIFHNGNYIVEFDEECNVPRHLVFNIVLEIEFVLWSMQHLCYWNMIASLQIKTQIVTVKLWIVIITNFEEVWNALNSVFNYFEWILKYTKYSKWIIDSGNISILFLHWFQWIISRNNVQCESMNTNFAERWFSKISCAILEMKFEWTCEYLIVWFAVFYKCTNALYKKSGLFRMNSIWESQLKKDRSSILW